MNIALQGLDALIPGATFPDLDLPDHTGRRRRLSELAGGDPLVLLTSRGWFCPKEQRHLRELVNLQDEFEVAYSRIVVVSVDPPSEQAAFRAGLGARFTFLSDAERRWIEPLGLRETTDTVHRPYQPAGGSRCSPTCGSTAPTTGTGTGGARRLTTSAGTCA